VADVWSAGAVIRSWLLELIAEGLSSTEIDISELAPIIDGGTTGKWAIQESLDLQVPIPTIQMALNIRYASRYDDGLSPKVLNWLRFRFGQHRLHRKKE
jgi:6-phosphogluconate dehydrogenase